MYSPWIVIVFTSSTILYNPCGVLIQTIPPICILLEWSFASWFDLPVYSDCWSYWQDQLSQNWVWQQVDWHSQGRWSHHPWSLCCSSNRRWERPPCLSMSSPKDSNKNEIFVLLLKLKEGRDFIFRGPPRVYIDKTFLKFWWRCYSVQSDQLILVLA